MDLATAAHGVEPGLIGMTLTFRLSDGRVIIFVARGDSRIDKLQGNIGRRSRASGQGFVKNSEGQIEITVGNGQWRA